MEPRFHGMLHDMAYDEAIALHALLSSTPDLVYFLDRDGLYRYVGESGKAAARRMPRALIERFEAQRVEVMATGRAVRDEAAYDAGGATLVIEYFVAPVVADGATAGVVVVTRDVTEQRRAEAALRASEKKFSIAFDRSPLALTITSLADGRLVDVNEGFVKMSGYTRDQAVGRSPDELGLWTAPEQRAERFRRMREGLEVPEIETRFTMKNGEERIGVVGSAVVDINGQPCVLSSVVDVTERKRAEESLRAREAEVREFADTAPAILWITEPDGSCTFFSRGWYEFTGQTIAESLGFGWLDRVHPDDRATVRNAFAAASARREPFALDCRVRGVDGEDHWVADAARPRWTPDGELAGFIGSVIDITDRKRAEQAKDEFLGTLSHELRTPLTSAYGWAKLLAKTREPELLDSGLRAIEESIVTQIRLIDDLLDVSRVAAGKMHVDLQPLDLASVVESAAEMIRPLAEAKGIALRFDVHPVTTVLGDAGRLRQVFWNLLSNAVKFTHAGTVDVVLRHEGAQVAVIVRDTGEGIDPQFLPLVFDRFRQADSSISRRHGGLGIGLSIVTSLVEAHHGSVRAESDGLDRGATFTVTLPRIVTRDVVRHAPVATSHSTDRVNARVVVVDDDPATRTLMVTTLEAAGAAVRACGSAREAYEVVTAWRPDILISDLAMPDDDGFSLLRRLRQAGIDVPAVAITAYTRPEDETRVREAGFQRHIAKPFDPEEIVRAVRDFANRSRDS